MVIKKIDKEASKDLTKRWDRNNSISDTITVSHSFTRFKRHVQIVAI